MKDRPEKKQTGRVNYIYTLAGLYLLYLAYKLFRDTATGATDYPLLGIGGGIVFAAIGGFLIYRECKAYRYGLEHIDDPSTWSDEPVEAEEAPEDPEEMPEDFGETPEDDEDLPEDPDGEKDGEDA